MRIFQHLSKPPSGIEEKVSSESVTPDPFGGIRRPDEYTIVLHMDNLGFVKT